MKPLRSIHIPLIRLRSAAALAAIVIFAATVAFASSAAARPLVVVDPGHGGIYNHARYGTLLEKQANLLFSLELGRQLYAAGYDVQFTRTTDTAVTYADIPTWHWMSSQNLWIYGIDGASWYSDGVPRDDLQARCNIANDLGADLFISIHCNGAASSAANGTENWASSHDVLGQQLGRYVQSAVLEQTHQRDRGAGQTDFYVVRWTNMPALLIETGFMSNPTEGARIASPSWRQAYVRGIVNGINRWMATDPIHPIHQRYTGAKRSESAVIASRTQWPAGAQTVLLASTLDTASAYAAPVAVAKLGAPLLYADPRELTPATLAELARLRPSRIIAFGEEIPDALLEQAALAAGVDISAVQRIAGTEPASGAPLLAEALYSAEESISVVFASGASPSDALAGATLAASQGSALILARADGSLPPEAAAFLAARAAKITRATTVGYVPDQALAGVPSRTRVGLGQPDQVFGTTVLAARPTGNLWLYGYNPTIPVDALTAVCAAANRAGGVPVPIAGKYLSAYTREWLENYGHRVSGTVMVGDYAVLPAAADHYVAKAIY